MITVAGVSGLDSATLTRLRADAEREHRSPFIDPVLYRNAESLLPRVSADWLAYVVGRPVAAWRYLSNAELALAVAAVQAGAEHPRAADEAARDAWLLESARREGEAARARQAKRDAWEALRCQIPVPVAVWHNWTARHLDGYEQGADHIVVLEDLRAGRLNRAVRHPLCWTPSRAHPLRHVTPNAGDENRVPDCKACLRAAQRFAEEEIRHKNTSR